MKLSKHSKMRITERAGIRKGKQLAFFRAALTHGKSIGNMEEGEIKDFLISKKNHNCNIKLYQNYVFIYSKNNKQLYTMYELPEFLKKKVVAI